MKTFFSNTCRRRGDESQTKTNFRDSSRRLLRDFNFACVTIFRRKSFCLRCRRGFFSGEQALCRGEILRRGGGLRKNSSDRRTIAGVVVQLRERGVQGRSSGPGHRRLPAGRPIVTARFRNSRQPGVCSQSSPGRGRARDPLAKLGRHPHAQRRRGADGGLVLADVCAADRAATSSGARSEVEHGHPDFSSR